MKDEFIRQMMGTFQKDDEYEDYLRRWIEYHRHADVDMPRARRALAPLNRDLHSKDAEEKWQRAKLEAVRLVDAEKKRRTWQGKYVLHPGKVRSKVDGELHYITPAQLARLYQVDPRECLVVDERYPNQYNDRNLIHLYPCYHGNYEIHRCAPFPKRCNGVDE